MTGNKWKNNDELWEKIALLLPEHKIHHPLGTHRKRVDNRAAMNVVFFVLRTGCQWNALNATGICSSSSTHRRFQKWCAAGVFERFWQNGLLVFEPSTGHGWQAQKPGRNPIDRGEQGVKRSLMTDANRFLL
uniref:Insertion element IS402-like domain-containing protein n=1 Tax=Pectobacterium carotovorum TaxID=554 RepID=A0A0N7FW18_PECCA|nr:Hypothetical protein [Pectobacterium carotovorum]